MRTEDRSYRRSLPDVTHHGFQLMTDAGLRRDVRTGLAEGYAAAGLVDDSFAGRLRSGGLTFFLFYLLGILPIVGRYMRKVWGNGHYRRHLAACITSWSYLGRTLNTKEALVLTGWVRSARSSDKHARFLVRHPVAFWIERFSLGLIPFPIIHRVISQPAVIVWQLGRMLIFIKRFYTDANFRERWFIATIDEGQKEGMLTQRERDAIVERVKDPFIVKYLKSVAVHFATLPVTQVVSVSIGGAAAAWMLANDYTWAEATATFALVVGFFQVFVISPGSICRGCYVLYLIIRERNFRDYAIAAPLSFVKYIGYLAFPLQMTSKYPELAQFLGGRWATSAVHIIPVFGEKGALLEHWMFDGFFNLPQMLAKWAKPRMKMLLSCWMVLGVALILGLFHIYALDPLGKIGANLILAGICVFILPRTVFLPILSTKMKPAAAANE